MPSELEIYRAGLVVLVGIAAPAGITQSLPHWGAVPNEASNTLTRRNTPTYSTAHRGQGNRKGSSLSHIPEQQPHDARANKRID